MTASAEKLTTARTSYIWMMGTDSHDVAIPGQGVVDFVNRLETYEMGLADGRIRLLRIGPDLYRELSDEERQETGRRWEWIGAEPIWKLGRAMWGIAQPKVLAMEELNGEKLRRYTLLVRPRRRDKDPALAELRHALHRNGADRITFDVWLTQDDHVRRLRTHITRFRTMRGDGRVTSSTVEYSDFDIPVDFTPHHRPEIALRPA
jgi:hypothetical protein